MRRDRCGRLWYLEIMFILSNFSLFAVTPCFSQEGQIPVNTNGLVLWLDASDSSTVELDDSGRMIQWEDKSGKYHHASQSEQSSRPEYRRESWDGKPAIVFNGINEYLTCPFVPASGADSL